MTPKFRGKRKDNGEWVYGYYVQRSHKDCCVYHYIYTGAYFEDEHQEGTDLEIYEVLPESVGMFTGKHDEDSKEVCEGDRVEWSWSKTHINLEGVIEWDNKNLRWIIANTYFAHNRQTPLSNYPVKIIGDIHTTPELMEGKG